MKTIALVLFTLIGCISHTMAQQPTKLPGIIVDHSPAASKKYIGSPSICILKNGNYIASHDFFGPNSEESTNAKTWIFESTDRGNSWHKIAEINQFWSGLFYHRNALYLMGTRNGEGDCIIRKSTDGGHTWTVPTDSQNGLLLKGTKDSGYHTAPVPVLLAKGRLWRAMEVVKPGGPWGGFQAFVLSVKKGKDLLNAANWTISNKRAMDKSLNKGSAWLEGNAVQAPDGSVKDFLRVHYIKKGEELAAILDVSADGKTLSFDTSKGVFDFPGGSKKFSIRYDKQSKRYWTLSNFVPTEYENGNQERVRNTLALCSSPDLRNWTINKIVLQSANVAKHGFQYADWQFDGADIIAAVRTAYDDAEGGADNQHNANYLLFKRIENFRKP